MAEDNLNEPAPPAPAAPETEVVAEAPPESKAPRLGGQVAAGLALILLGAALLALEQLDGPSEHLFLILVGGVFAAAYLYRRSVGFLIPGALMLGLGGVLVLDDVSSGLPLDEVSAFGLGAGFLLIWVASVLFERRNRWWSLIPGGVLVGASLPYLSWTANVLEFWPLAIMAVGGFVLFRVVVAAQRRREEERRRSF